MIDTSNTTAAELRTLINGNFGRADTLDLTVSVVSFSYRLGLPRESDIVFDARFLANPHYVDELRSLTGCDPAVGAYIADDPECEPFLESINHMLQTLIPLYQKEGKSYLTVAIGCTGGRHRSVYIAGALTRRLLEAGHQSSVRHRDAEK